MYVYKARINFYWFVRRRMPWLLRSYHGGPWRTCVSWLSLTSTNTTFLSKATDYFSHMLLQRWEAKIRRKESSSQPGIELTTTRLWVRHAHHWATRAGRRMPWDEMLLNRAEELSDAICLFPFIYRCYRLPIRETPLRRRLVVTGDSVRIQGKTTESSAWFFNVLGA